MFSSVLILALVAALIIGLVWHFQQSTSDKIAGAAKAVGGDIQGAAHNAKDAVKDATN